MRIRYVKDASEESEDASSSERDEETPTEKRYSKKDII